MRSFSCLKQLNYYVLLHCPFLLSNLRWTVKALLLWQSYKPLLTHCGCSLKKYVNVSHYQYLHLQKVIEWKVVIKTANANKLTEIIYLQCIDLTFTFGTKYVFLILLACFQVPFWMQMYFLQCGTSSSGGTSGKWLSTFSQVLYFSISCSEYLKWVI